MRNFMICTVSVLLVVALSASAVGEDPVQAPNPGAAQSEDAGGKKPAKVKQPQEDIQKLREQLERVLKENARLKQEKEEKERKEWQEKVRAAEEKARKAQEEARRLREQLAAQKKKQAPKPQLEKRLWRPLYYFHYPLGVDGFPDMPNSLDIDIAMPASNGQSLQFAPPFQRLASGAIVWKPIYRTMKIAPGTLQIVGVENIKKRFDDTGIVRIHSGDVGYAQAQWLLKSCGMWLQDGLNRQIVHVYPKELRQRMTALWKDRYRRDRAFWGRGLGNLQYARFGFRQHWNGTWEVYLKALGYDS